MKDIKGENVDIRGHDIILPYRHNKNDFILKAIEIIKEIWSDLVVEEYGEDFFFYKSQEIKERWEKGGWHESLDNTMVHFIINDDLQIINVVVDDPWLDINRKIIDKLKNMPN